MENFKQNLNSARTRIVNGISWQSMALFDYLDPICSGRITTSLDSPNASKWNFTFLFPFLLLILSMAYSYIFLVYREVGVWSVEAIKNSTVVLFHQVYPRSLWPQTDALVLIGVTESIIIYASFFRNLFKANRYYLLDSNGGEKVLKIGADGRFYF